MLTPEDIKQIAQEMGKVIETYVTPKFDEMYTRLAHEMGRIIEMNVTPQFDQIYTRLDGIDQRFDGIDKRFESIDKRFDRIEAVMVTKSYLDDKLADLEGATVVRQRKQDDKVNRFF